jgi:hypothetical protein
VPSGCSGDGKGEALSGHPPLMKESTLDTLSRRLTARRFKAKNALTKNRVCCATPVGAAVTADVFLGPLADFLAGKLSDKPNPLPKALPEGIQGP